MTLTQVMKLDEMATTSSTAAQSEPSRGRSVITLGTDLLFLHLVRAQREPGWPLSCRYTD